MNITFIQNDSTTQIDIPTLLSVLHFTAYIRQLENELSDCPNPSAPSPPPEGGRRPSDSDKYRPLGDLLRAAGYQPSISHIRRPTRPARHVPDSLIQTKDLYSSRKEPFVGWKLYGLWSAAPGGYVNPRPRIKNTREFGGTERRTLSQPV